MFCNCTAAIALLLNPCYEQIPWCTLFWKGPGVSEWQAFLRGWGAPRHTLGGRSGWVAPNCMFISVRLLHEKRLFSIVSTIWLCPSLHKHNTNVQLAQNWTETGTGLKELYTAEIADGSSSGPPRGDKKTTNNHKWNVGKPFKTLW